MSRNLPLANVITLGVVDLAAQRDFYRRLAPEFFAGRHAYFADPEGNFWEVAWSGSDNPVTVAARRAAGM